MVHLTGTYGCTGARSLHITGTLIEIVGTQGAERPLRHARRSRAHLQRPAAPVDRTGPPGHEQHLRRAKRPRSPTRAACGAIVCTLVSETSVVNAGDSAAGTSALAPDVKSQHPDGPSFLRQPATGMPFTPPRPAGVTRHQDVKTDHADTSSNEALVSRFLKASDGCDARERGRRSSALAAPPAIAGPARIGKITVKHVRLDWTPTRTRGGLRVAEGADGREHDDPDVHRDRARRRVDVQLHDGRQEPVRGPDDAEHHGQHHADSRCHQVLERRHVGPDA